MEWLNFISRFKSSTAWRTVSEEGRKFIDSFEVNLRETCLSGARANVVTPFTCAVRSLLNERGLAVESSPPSVLIAPGLCRSADIAFNCNGERWVVEIKVALEFNSLGAAVLEALAFRARAPEAKLILLSLYDKCRRGELLSVLSTCNLSHTFDQIHILTSNADSLAVCDDNWARNLNRFTQALPLPNNRNA